MKLLHRRSSEILAPPPGELDIALWGPTGAGKTCLVYALARELMSYNRANAEQVEYKLQHRLPDGSSLPILRDGTLDRPPATDEAKDSIIQFVRVSRKTGATVTHNLNVHDDKGLNAIRVGEVSSASVSLGTTWARDLDIAEANVTASVAILAFLDLGYQESSPSAPELGILADDKHYCQRMENLLDFLAGLRGPVKKRLAVCISKADRRPEWKANVNLQMLRAFRDTKALLESRKDQPGLTIKLFQTSAVGFLRNGQPNFDSDSGWLISPRHWDPWNTAMPFFWIFEEMEKDFLPLEERHTYPNPRPHW